VCRKKKGKQVSMGAKKGTKKGRRKQKKSMQFGERRQEKRQQCLSQRKKEIDNKSRALISEKGDGQNDVEARKRRKGEPTSGGEKGKIKNEGVGGGDCATTELENGYDKNQKNPKERNGFVQQDLIIRTRECSPQKKAGGGRGEKKRGRWEHELEGLTAEREKLGVEYFGVN